MSVYFARVAFVAAILFSTLLGPTAADAATSYQRTFVERYRGSECYGRDYGPADWRRNPRLKFGSIAVRVRPTTNTTLAPSNSRLFGVQLGITTRSGAEYTSLADCKPSGKNFKCQLESDGGEFRLLRVPSGLRIETRRISIEGSSKFLDVSSRSGKPARSFTLYAHAAAPCDFGD